MMSPTYSPIGDVPLRYRVASRPRQVALYALGVVLFIAGSLLVSQQQQPSPLRTTTTSGAVSSEADFPGAADEIQSLPGKPDAYTSRLFSGYLPVGNGGEAFYFFAESQSANASADPVLLWLNGGPGASSLSGCFTENGPLLVNEDGKTLRVNDYAWNKDANFLCIESPVGVGFSYNASGVYASDDLAQADELYWMLQSFFSKFPALRANDFVISGESYGGIYVPTTAKRIVEGNQKNDTATKINLTKFVVGNGVNEFGGLSAILYAYYHGLLSTQDYRRVRSSCPDLKEFEPSKNAFLGGDLTSPCAVAMLDVLTRLYSYHINSYDIYGACVGTTEEGVRALVAELLAPASGLPHPIGNPMSMCLDARHVESYFNLPSVRTAMHTNPAIVRWSGDALTTTSLDLFGKLMGVNATVAAGMKQHTLLEYEATLGAVVRPLWTFLLDHGVDAVIYHGDTDMVCDFIGGLWAVESLQLPRQQPRAIWTVKDADGADQTAGFLEDFGTLKYVTVKGAGHLVPQVKPVSAKKMLDLFVLN
jgi:cathepsin A (carboxypeptidase C)